MLPVSVALCSYAVDYNMTLKWLGKRANNAAMQPSYSATCARLHYVLVLCLSVSRSVSPSVCRMCDRVKGQNPLHQFPRNKFVTSWKLPRLRESYRETCVMDFGHNGALEELSLLAKFSPPLPAFYIYSTRGSFKSPPVPVSYCK